MTFSVETATGQSSTLATCTVAGFTVTAANLIMAGLTVGDPSGANGPFDDVTGITRDGQNFSLISGSTAENDAWCGARWYYLANPNVNSADITVGGSNLIEQCALHIISFIDASLTMKTPSIQVYTANCPADPSVTVADSANGDIVVACLSHDGSGVTTSNPNTTIFNADNLQTDTDHNSHYKTATGANTVMSWTNSTTNENASMSGIAIAAGTAATGTKLPFLNFFGRSGNRPVRRYPLRAMAGSFMLPTLAERMRYAA